MDELVLARAPGGDGLVALARSFDDDFLHAAHPLRVASEGGPLDHNSEASEPLRADVRGHEAIVHRRCLGAWPGREDEGVRAVVARFGDDLEGALEVGVGLAGEAHDEVGRDREVADGGARRREPLEVALRGVSAMHRGERAVTAGLERQVQVLAHRGRRGHRLDRVRAQVFRMGTREPNPADALDPADRPEQVSEEGADPFGAARLPCSQREIAAVGVDVLAEQSDLGDAVRGERLDFGDELREGPADLGATHGGHDAESAAVVAPDLDGHPRAVSPLALGGEGGRKRRAVVGDGRFEHLDDRPVPA